MGIWFSVVPAPASKTDKEAKANSSEWLIDGSQGLFPNLRWTTINAAIRYVLETRARTSDPVIKQNAERTLAILLRYE